MGAVWIYLLSKKVILDNKIEFPELKYGEDLIFISQYLLCCKGIGIINKAFIYYRNRASSAMHGHRAIEDKMDSIKKKGLVLQRVPEGEKKAFCQKWQGQLCLIAMNSPRKDSYSEYMQLIKMPEMRDAIELFELKKANWKFRIVMGLLKCKFYSLYWLLIRLAMMTGELKV